MPPKRNIGKSSHKQRPVMLGSERKCRKCSHEAKAYANKLKPIRLSMGQERVLSFFEGSSHKRNEKNDTKMPVLHPAVALKLSH
jgi:hypothetical protein